MKRKVTSIVLLTAIAFLTIKSAVGIKELPSKNITSMNQEQIDTIKNTATTFNIMISAAIISITGRIIIDDIKRIMADNELVK